MIQIEYENMPESPFISGYLKMKSAIITNWYPKATSVAFLITKNPEDKEKTYTVRGTITFKSAVTESHTYADTAVLAIDQLLKQIDPSDNMIPPASQSIASEASI